MDLETLTSPLMSALGAVGHVLDTPRRALYGGLSALTGNDWKGFGDVVSSTGLMNKDSTGYGVVDFLGNVATDPMTWGGLAAGRYLNALTPTREAMQAAGKATGKATANSMNNMRTLLDDVPVVDKVEVLAPGDRLFTQTQRTTRLPDNQLRTTTYDDRQLMGRVRRGLDDDRTQWAPGAGAGAANTPDGELSRRMLMQLDTLEDPYTHAVFNNTALGDRANVPGIFVANNTHHPNTALRHESMHAMIDQAARTGQIDRLPNMLARTSARLQTGGDKAGFGNTAGKIMEEAAAHAVESRNPVQQIKNALGFAFNPRVNANYSQVYRADGGMNKAALDLYSRLPGLAQPMTTTAAASPGALLRALNGE